MMTQIIRFLDRPELVTRNAVLACYALPMLLYLWVVFRALRFSSRVKRADFEHPEPDKRRWRLCTLCVSLIMIALTAVLVLFVFPHAPDQEEIFQCAWLMNQYPMYLLAMLVAFVCLPLVGFCWRAAISDQKGCLVRGISILALIYTGLGAIFMPVGAVFMVGMGSFGDLEERAFHQATAYYEAGFYHQASACFEVLSQMNLSRNQNEIHADAKNNLALCCLQLGKNEEALEIMRELVKETRDPYYIINLLVAAQVNGLCAREILTEIDAERILNGSEPIKLANALAYNIAWMDMELRQDEAYRAVNMSEELFASDRLLAIEAKRSKSEMLHDYDVILLKMNFSNRNTLGEEDPDINALQTYLKSLKDGGEPQTVSAE